MSFVTEKKQNRLQQRNMPTLQEGLQESFPLAVSS